MSASAPTPTTAIQASSAATWAEPPRIPEEAQFLIARVSLKLARDELRGRALTTGGQADQHCDPPSTRSTWPDTRRAQRTGEELDNPRDFIYKCKAVKRAFGDESLFVHLSCLQEPPRARRNRPVRVSPGAMLLTFTL